MLDGLSNLVWNRVNLSANGTATQYGIVIQSSLYANISNITIENSRITGFHLGNWSSDFSVEVLIAAHNIYNTTSVVCAQISNIRILNNTIGGAIGPGSPDDSGIEANSALNGASPHSMCTVKLSPATMQVSNVTIEGNTIANIGGRSASLNNECCYGVVMLASNDVQINYNLVHDIGVNVSSSHGNEGLGAYDDSNVTYSYNEIYNIRKASGIDGVGVLIDGGSMNSLAEYNYIHDTNGAGIQFSPEAGDTGWGPNTARYNVVENVSLTHARGEFAGGIIVTAKNTKPLYIYNNTIYMTGSNGAYGIQITGTTGNPAGYVANNIIAVRTLGGYADFVSVTGRTGTASANMVSNAYYLLGSGTFRAVSAGTTYTSLSEWQAVVPGSEVGATTAAASWTGTPPVGTCSWSPQYDTGPQPCPGAYSLGSGSAYIGVGLDLTKSPYSQTVGSQNYYGNAIPRGTGTGYNIGAY